MITELFSVFVVVLYLKRGRLCVFLVFTCLSVELHWCPLWFNVLKYFCAHFQTLTVVIKQAAFVAVPCIVPHSQSSLGETPLIT